MPADSEPLFEITDVAVEDLSLDPENPRLPDELQGAKEPKLLRYLRETANLDELAQSYVDNGVFPHEPLIATKRNRKLIVIEGNRRLATLKILLGLPGTEELSFPSITLTAQRCKTLAQVPYFEVLDNDDQIETYLGFRHIGGIKTWSAQSKARWIYTAIEKRLADAKTHDLFNVIGRRVGLDRTTVRMSYLAYALLTEGKKRGVNVSILLSHDERRFGVWLRAMSSPQIRQYLGLEEVGTLTDIREGIRKTPRRSLERVVTDIAPPMGLETVLPDSRDVTTYGRVLAHPTAEKELRTSRNLEAASELIEGEKLALRLTKITRGLNRLARDVLEADPSSADLKDLRLGLEELDEANERLRKAVRGASAK